MRGSLDTFGEIELELLGLSENERRFWNDVDELESLCEDLPVWERVMEVRGRIEEIKAMMLFEREIELLAEELKEMARVCYGVLEVKVGDVIGEELIGKKRRDENLMVEDAMRLVGRLSREGEGIQAGMLFAAWKKLSRFAEKVEGARLVCESIDRSLMAKLEKLMVIVGGFEKVNVLEDETIKINVANKMTQKAIRERFLRFGYDEKIAVKRRKMRKRSLWGKDELVVWQEIEVGGWDKMKLLLELLEILERRDNTVCVGK